MKSSYIFEHLLLPGGIASRQKIILDDSGKIEEIREADVNERPDHWFGMPGMPNSHSHIFQRAMAGHAEKRTGGDSFWSWRALMYDLANKITPEDMLHIARWGFIEMMKGGYTSLAEFHYVHHDTAPDMAEAVIQAAKDVGLPLTLLPVLYQHSGFNKQPPETHQKRFVYADFDAYTDYLLNLQHKTPIGVAYHSLRAVDVGDIASYTQTLQKALGKQTPFHIHISEQQAEVNACEAAYGQTPLTLLTDNLPVDANWNYIHATHATEAELAHIGKTGGRVVMCPLTEAHLGDGLCNLTALMEAQGGISLGSDANICMDAIEEVRLLEYGQRLRTQSRNVLYPPDQEMGVALWQHCSMNGGKSLGRKTGVLAPGYEADFITLNKHAPIFAGHTPQTIPSALLTAGTAAALEDIYINGKQILKNRTHPEETEAYAAFCRSLNALMV